MPLYVQSTSSVQSINSTSINLTVYTQQLRGWGSFLSCGGNVSMMCAGYRPKWSFQSISNIEGTLGLAVSQSWCRAPCGAPDQILVRGWQLLSSPYGTPSLTRGSKRRFPLIRWYRAVSVIGKPLYRNCNFCHTADQSIKQRLRVREGRVVFAAGVGKCLCSP
jgi:hypothetical protein